MKSYTDFFFGEAALGSTSSSVLVLPLVLVLRLLISDMPGLRLIVLPYHCIRVPSIERSSGGLGPFLTKFVVVNKLEVPASSTMLVRLLMFEIPG